MKKQYECQDCGAQFVLGASREPYCPECESQTITFEGYIEASLFERFWNRIKPVINFWIFPWKFFAGRSIRILNSHILMVLSVAVLLVATWQVALLPGADTPSIFINFLSVFRNYSHFVDLLFGGSAFSDFLPAPLVVFVILLFIEFAFFEIFNILQGILGARADQSQTGLIFSAAVWIPNILLGTFTFIVARGAAFGFWSPGILTESPVQVVGRVIALWCLYILVGGCFSLPDISFISSVILVPLAAICQFIFAVIIIFAMNIYLLPFLGIQPLTAPGGLFQVALRLICFPLLYLPFF